MEITRISVIGAGIMGMGITKAIFKQGYPVILFDTDEAKLSETIEQIKKGARRSQNSDLVRGSASLVEALQNADLAIEAAVENLEIKSEIFSQMGRLAPSRTILASNTSSLSVESLAHASTVPERVLGLHFFNPAFLMRLVEVITHPGLDEKNLASAMEFIGRLKKEAVLCRDSPGFIVNRILIPVVNEAFHRLEGFSGDDLIQESLDIDSSVSASGVLPMGPFNLVDLIGIDTTHAAAERLYHGFDEDRRYEPAPLLREYARKGFYGRKSRRGIYYYANTAIDPDYNPRLDRIGQKMEDIPTPRFSSDDLMAVIINEAFRVIEEKLTPDYRAIDLAMELGTRWTEGPFSLLRSKGRNAVISRLESLGRDSPESRRYSISGALLDPPREIRIFLEEDAREREYR